MHGIIRSQEFYCYYKEKDTCVTNTNIFSYPLNSYI